MIENDYESLINYDYESGYDDCENCPYKYDCKSQCMEIETHINPQLEKYFRK